MLSYRWPRAAVFAAMVTTVAMFGWIPTISLAQSLPTTAHDSKLPIEITADSLEVKQNEQLAVFRGHVDANKARCDSRQTKCGCVIAQNRTVSLKHNFADQRHGRCCFFDPQRDRTGDSGVYDVDDQVITLTGSVVLTRGGNVIRGEKLVLNLATGQSKIESTQRVRGLFQPKKSGSGS